MEDRTRVHVGSVDSFLATVGDNDPAVRPEGYLALVAEADKESVPLLQTYCREKGYTLIGALFPELIYEGAFLKEGALILPVRRMPPRLLIEGIEEEGGAALARFAEEESERGEGTLFMFFDAMIPTIGKILDTLFSKLGDRVRYAGVNAGSETFTPIPCLFTEERFVGGGCLALFLEGKEELSLGHGYTSAQEPLVATSTEGNRITHIQWRPAFEVYQELAEKQYGIKVDKESFYRFGVHYPFGILRACGETLVRIPVALEEDGSVFCVGEVPPNAMLLLLEAPKAGSLETVEQVAEGMKGWPDEVFPLTFYCAGRRMSLQQGATDELSALKERTPGGVSVGALSLGEIGSSSDGMYPLFHNGAIVSIPWGRP